MRLALELAEKGRGNVSPNPMVGCVIVYENIVIGQGFHEKYGEPHAEPNAVSSVVDKTLIKEATVYVTLEPCAHYGNTPPCARLLADLKPKRVVIGAIDANPLVENKGVKILEEAGIEVTSGVLSKESKQLNTRFFTNMEKQRPYIILKWAESKDGFIGGKNYEQVAISNTESQKISHQLRADEDAILVGTNTAFYDNPSLTTRHVKGKNPLRLFIDKDLKIPDGHKLVNNLVSTVCYNSIKDEKQDKLAYVCLKENDYVHQILKDLKARKVGSLIVEGGAQLLQSFIDNNLWDEAYVFKSDQNLEEGIKAPVFNFTPDEEVGMNGDLLLKFKNA